MTGYKQHEFYARSKIILTVAFVIFLLGISIMVKAQEDPPRPPSISLKTNMSFGAFYNGASGGTVTVDEMGVRTVTGDVVPFSLGFPVSAVHFNIYANAGTVISFLNIPDFPLTWSGYSMNVHIGTSNPTIPFVNVNPYSVATELTIGATLNVGNSTANPPGSYTGTFDVTLVIE